MVAAAPLSLCIFTFCKWGTVMRGHGPATIIAGLGYSSVGTRWALRECQSLGRLRHRRLCRPRFRSWLPGSQRPCLPTGSRRRQLGAFARATAATCSWSGPCSRPRPSPVASPASSAADASHEVAQKTLVEYMPSPELFVAFRASTITLIFESYLQQEVDVGGGIVATFSSQDFCRHCVCQE
jgi:hypothetical protein